MKLTKNQINNKAVGGTNKVPKDFELLDRYWSASNYLTVGQIYLLDKNPLLKEKLKPEHIKPRLLGHFGTTPGQNLIYVHLNRLVKERSLNCIYVAGPGHGGPAIVAQVYLEGTYTKFYPEITQDEVGIGKLFKQFSFPGGIPSHVAPETPGSIHEGGELGYSLSHSFGAVLDKPDLLVACVVGDGEAETGPLATSWHGNKFINPEHDGAVLPILHLNGYKIANPSILSRMPEEELLSLFKGYGWEPIVVEGDDPAKLHPAMAMALDQCVDKIRAIQNDARAPTTNGKRARPQRPTWPMILLRTPKGWTGPGNVDGVKIEDSFKSHQVPVNDMRSNKDHLKILEQWLKSYKPETLFDQNGALLPELQELIPPPELCMGNNRLTNPEEKPLILPDFSKFGVKVDKNARGKVEASAMYTTGVFLREVISANPETFRMFGPDETKSNRLHAVYEATKKQWNGGYLDREVDDEAMIAPHGRVIEMLSEHQCEGMLEGYLLTGRHGLLNSYEAFIHILSSMFNQHAKWLKVTRGISWRSKLPSLNILLSSHVWRQDHNGFTHQDPGFLQHVASKRPEIVHIYLPPDANCLLSTMHHCLGSQHYVNVIVAGKHASPQWLSIEEAREHCAAGLGIWKFASNDEDKLPDLIMACAGDVPTLEALAATSILRKSLPNIRIRVVNIVDIMRLSIPQKHPHGMSTASFDAIFPEGSPVLFNFHGYPDLVEKLLFGRRHREQFKVNGYEEQGDITTPFDMCVMNRIDRFSLVMDACDIVQNSSSITDEELASKMPYLRQEMQHTLVRHKQYIHQHGVDIDEVAQWTWDL